MQPAVVVASGLLILSSTWRHTAVAPSNMHNSMIGGILMTYVSKVITISITIAVGRVLSYEPFGIRS